MNKINLRTLKKSNVTCTTSFTILSVQIDQIDVLPSLKRQFKYLFMSWLKPNIYIHYHINLKILNCNT